MKEYEKRKVKGFTLGLELFSILPAVNVISAILMLEIKHPTVFFPIAIILEVISAVFTVRFYDAARHGWAMDELHEKGAWLHFAALIVCILPLFDAGHMDYHAFTEALFSYPSIFFFLWAVTGGIASHLVRRTLDKDYARSHLISIGMKVFCWLSVLWGMLYLM